MTRSPSQLSSRLKYAGISILALQVALSGPAMADDDELLKRVERLEKLVEQLLANQSRSAEPAGPAEIALIEETQRMISVQKEELQAQNARVEKLESFKIGENIRDLELNNGFNIGDTNFKLGGFLKADMSVSKFSDGELASGAWGRDFFIPAQVPVSPTGDGDGADIDFNARETRFGFRSETPTEFGKITANIEFDFLVTNGGNEVVSNSYLPRMRHAYISFNGWTFGQAWSTFQDLKVWQDHLDFLGSIPGMVLNRQALIRYQNGPFEIAVETPETVLTDVTGSRVVSGDGALPDLVMRYTHQGSWGHIRAAGILRNLQAEAGTGTLVDGDSTLGYGLNLSGKFKTVGRDNFSFKVNAGEGLGRYLSLGLISDALVTPTGELEAIGTISGFASYQHHWNDKWRSNVSVGFLEADYPDTFQVATVSDSAFSIHGNLLYSPVKRLTLGIEYIYGQRGVIGGFSGDLNRIQFSTKLGW